jgi:hypothetical protein
LKFDRTPAFDGDWQRLSADERETFKRWVRERFHPACERRREDPAAPWPKAVRVRAVQAASGILEATWSFAGPDGRATFEWVTVNDEPRILWRRIGGHEIFRNP